MSYYTSFLSINIILFLLLIINKCLATENESIDKGNGKINDKSDSNILSKLKQINNFNGPVILTKNDKTKSINKISSSFSEDIDGDDTTEYNGDITSIVQEYQYKLNSDIPKVQGENKSSHKDWTLEDKELENDVYEDDDEDDLLLGVVGTPETRTMPNHIDNEAMEINDQLNRNDFGSFGLDISRIEDLPVNEIADEDGFDGVKPEVHLPEFPKTSDFKSEDRLLHYDFSFGNHVGQVMLCLIMLVSLVIVVYIVYLNNPTAVKLVRGKYQEWKYPGKTFVRLDSELGDPLLSRKEDCHP